MSDDSDPRRDALDTFLREQGPPPHDGDGMDRPAVLTGWVMATEWMDDEGGRWIAKAHSSSLAVWHAEGMHHHALYGDWSRD